MRALFPDHPEAADNTVKIAQLCSFDFEFGNYKLPRFKLPAGETDSWEYLKKLCEKGFAERFPDRPEIHGQLEYELDMIHRMGFARKASPSASPTGPRSTGSSSTSWT